MIALIQSSDVTTIAENTHIFYEYILNTYIPYAVTGIQTGVESGIDALNQNITDMNGALFGINMIIGSLQTMQNELLLLDPSAYGGSKVTDLVSPSTVALLSQSVIDQLSEVTTYDGFITVLGSYQGQKTGLESAIAQLTTLVDEMNAFDQDVPVEFNLAIQNYLSDIDQNTQAIEDAYQTTINSGFRNIYLSTLTAGLLGIIVLRFYTSHKKED